ncbi:MAG: ATP-binding cassette domain-containing protein, partial [Planctomycetota bacterium]
MALITVRDVSIRFNGPPLLDGVSCQIEAGQKIGLLGRNGAGKTTFMRILVGQTKPDEGESTIAPDAKAALLPQEVPRSLSGSVEHVVSSALPELAEDRRWENHRRLDKILRQMELDAAAQVETLSSGMKRRVVLARTLVAEPDVLLLDEPTNHLDMDAIAWLEKFLKRWSGTLVFVTHDRMFLRNTAERILEVDRGKLFDWSCDYDTFLKRKEAALDAEEKQQALFDKKLAAEEAWIRQGVKARRTRNEGRVRA